MIAVATESQHAASRTRLQAFIVLELLAIITLRLSSWADSTSLYLLLDVFCVVIILASRLIANEVVLIVFLLMNYYAYAFPLNDALGLLDYDQLTFFQSLTARGLIFPEDLARYLMIVLIFKAVFLFFAARSAPLRAGDWVAIFYLPIPLHAVTAWALVATVFYYFLGWGFFGLNAMFWLVVLSASGIRKMAAKYSLWLFPFLVFAAVVSFLITRSRFPLAIIAPYVAVILSRRYGLRSSTAFLFLILSLAMMSLFAQLRDLGDMTIELYKEGTGIEALGEGGNVFLVGAHISGLASNGASPPELQDSVLSKFLRTIPFIEKDDMLAVRYVRSFFPQTFAAGGGFAFPLPAEVFLLGGYWGVAGLAGLLGQLLALALARIRNSYGALMIWLLAVPLLRQEFSVTVVHVIYIGVTVLAMTHIQRVGERLAARSDPLGRGRISEVGVGL